MTLIITIVASLSKEENKIKQNLFSMQRSDPEETSRILAKGNGKIHAHINKISRSLKSSSSSRSSSSSESSRSKGKGKVVLHSKTPKSKGSKPLSSKAPKSTKSPGKGSKSHKSSKILKSGKHGHGKGSKSLSAKSSKSGKSYGKASKSKSSKSPKSSKNCDSLSGKGSLRGNKCDDSEVPRDDDDAVPPNPNAPCDTPEGRKADILEIVDNITGFIPKDTPQDLALSWLMDDTNTNACDGNEVVIERYALATFYFSTNGDLWSDKDGWLSPFSVCQAWNGTICNEDDRVIEINLRKYYLDN
jgi:hypothetical protein